MLSKKNVNFVTMNKRPHILRVLSTVPLILFLTLFPHHHHHGGAACWSFDSGGCDVQSCCGHVETAESHASHAAHRGCGSHGLCFWQMMQRQVQELCFSHANGSNGIGDLLQHIYDFCVGKSLMLRPSFIPLSAHPVLTATPFCDACKHGVSVSRRGPPQFTVLHT